MARRGTPLVAALVLLALAWLTRPASAQVTCAGDCDGSSSVAINELIICVNIALGAAPVTTCSACDVDGNGTVAINELVLAVNAALSNCGTTTSTPTPTPGGSAICGNGTMEPGEDCDDGNTFGGDGCAANCTTEHRREADLDPAGSIATVQIPAFPIILNLTGHQVLTAGGIRDEAVFGPGGVKLFEPGEIPLVTKAADIQFNPIAVLGQVCVCVRGVEVAEAFGPGNAGAGRVGCGDQGLMNVDVKVEQDHDTTPGRAGNSGPSMGLPDDPTCTATNTLGPGLVSSACLEGTGASCSGSNNIHPGACNSPRVTTFSGGQGPVGSTILISNTQLGQLANLADDPCTATIVGGACSAPDFGPDCMPCTEDDLQKGTPNVGVATSGMASAIIYDVADTAGVHLGPGDDCNGQPCVASVTGAPTDCAAIRANPDGPLVGTLVTASPSLDQMTIGDGLTTTTLKAKNP